MSIAEKFKTIAENVQKVFNAGKKAEYDAFWDVFQENGTRQIYDSAFARQYWNGTNFKPKYDIKPSEATTMFYRFGGECLSATDGKPAYDIAQILEDCGVILDTSKVPSFVNFFYYSSVSRVPEINVTGATSALTGMFALARKLRKIDKLVLKEDGSNTFNNTFQNAISLTDITIEGTIGANFEMKESPLNKESVESIVNALSTKTSGLTATFRTSVKNNFPDDEWATLIATKPNWTISLV